MLTMIMGVAVGVAFLCAVNQINKKENKVEAEGKSTTGIVTGFYTLDGGDVCINIRFEDETGVERRGRSQQFARTYDRYKLGDNINIKYVIKKSMGLETVMIRVQDSQMKEGGAITLKVLRIMGILFIALGILSLAI